LNGTKKGDKEITVMVHAIKKNRSDIGEHFTNLFVKNIPTDFSDEQLSDLFKEFGDITSCKVKGNNEDVGFVMFKTHEQAAAAIEALNQKKEINGKMIFVSKFIYKSENQKNTEEGLIDQQMKETFKSNIHVRNIPA
jgi:polyadenylate-binding protein